MNGVYFAERGSWDIHFRQLETYQIAHPVCNCMNALSPTFSTPCGVAEGSGMWQRGQQAGKLG
jgi:hypothetical protein